MTPEQRRGDRFIPDIRQLTGAGAYHAYVYDKKSPKRPVAACRHAHRTARTAWKCARIMARAALAKLEGQR